MEQTKNAGQEAVEMGEIVGIVRKHYFESVDAKATHDYWSIKPVPSTERKIVRIA